MIAIATMIADLCKQEKKLVAKEGRETLVALSLGLAASKTKSWV